MDDRVSKRAYAILWSLESDAYHARGGHSSRLAQHIAKGISSLTLSRMAEARAQSQVEKSSADESVIFLPPWRVANNQIVCWLTKIGASYAERTPKSHEKEMFEKIIDWTKNRIANFAVEDVSVPHHEWTPRRRALFNAVTEEAKKFQQFEHKSIVFKQKLSEIAVKAAAENERLRLSAQKEREGEGASAAVAKARTESEKVIDAAIACVRATEIARTDQSNV